MGIFLVVYYSNQILPLVKESFFTFRELETIYAFTKLAHIFKSFLYKLKQFYI
jgi:hypothetical protein